MAHDHLQYYEKISFENEFNSQIVTEIDNLADVFDDDQEECADNCNTKQNTKSTYSSVKMLHRNFKKGDAWRLFQKNYLK